MRRLVTAAISAAIITTTTWSQAKADAISLYEAQILAACGPPCYRLLPVIQQRVALLYGIGSENHTSSLGFEQGTSAVIQAVTGMPQQPIPVPSFGKCNINNFLKTCF